MNLQEKLRKLKVGESVPVEPGDAPPGTDKLLMPALTEHDAKSGKLKETSPEMEICVIGGQWKRVK